MLSKTDIVWEGVDGPVTSAEVSEITVLMQREHNSFLRHLWLLGRIERAPYRANAHRPKGGGQFGAYIYYGNEQRPHEHQESELMARRRRRAEAIHAEAAAEAEAFNAWLRTG